MNHGYSGCSSVQRLLRCECYLQCHLLTKFVTKLFFKLLHQIFKIFKIIIPHICNQNPHICEVSLKTLDNYFISTKQFSNIFLVQRHLIFENQKPQIENLRKEFIGRIKYDFEVLKIILTYFQNNNPNEIKSKKNALK